MFACSKQSVMIKIVHSFTWFVQVTVAVICMMIALVVGQEDENPPKEPEPESEESPAETSDAPNEDDLWCINKCENNLVTCTKPCNDNSEESTVVCTFKCMYLEGLCFGDCLLPW